MSESMSNEERYRNALLWIRMVAGLHYFGEAYDPEHMRGLANMAADALAGKEIKDFEVEMAAAKIKAQETADRIGIELIYDEDLDTT